MQGYTITMLHLSEIVLAIVAFGTLVAAQECEEGWYEITPPGARTMRCASYISDRRPYGEAQAWCKNRANVPGRRGQLAVIPDKATQRRLENAVREASGGLFPGWIGLKKSEELDQDLERYWQWENSDRLRDESYRNWAPNTPNNDQQYGGQDCVYMNDYRISGSWNDFECSNFLNFVCQYDA